MIALQNDLDCEWSVRELILVFCDFVGDGVFVLNPLTIRAAIFVRDPGDASYIKSMTHRIPFNLFGR